MPRNSIRVRFDPGTPPLNLPAIIEFEHREEMMLAAIDPGSGYQRSGLEVTGIPFLVVLRQRQLVDDEVNDVLGDVHCVVSESWGLRRKIKRGRVNANHPLIRI